MSVDRQASDGAHNNVSRPARNPGANALVLPLALLCALPVRAWSADIALAEVLVTAQRQAEPLLRVPISISVVSSTSLIGTAARDLSAIAAFAPNVSLDSVVTNGGSTATSIYIRGIGQSDMLQTTDPGVGLFVDGVYVSRSVGSLVDVADVERIEVLRGPQGTLFGRNTVGGAINLVTRPPRNELAFAARVTTGSDDRLDAFARLDLPFSDSVRSKISLASFDQDGYVTRVVAGDRIGDRHRRVARAQLEYSDQERFVLSLSADYTRIDEAGVPATLRRVVQLCPAGVTNAIGGCDGNIAPGAPPGQAFLFNNVMPVNLAAGGAGIGTSIYDERFIPGDPFENLGTGLEKSTLDLLGVSAILDWKFSTFDLRSITAWRAFDAFFTRDTDISPYRIITPSSRVDQRQFSQEFQAFSKSGTPFAWLAGLYYLDEEADDDSTFETASFLSRNGGRDIVSRSAAVFGQATWHFTDEFSITAGGRYTEEEKSYVPVQYIVSSVTGQPPAGLVIIPPVQNELEDSKATWRAVVEYAPTTRLLLYTSWSTGFKSGGFVQRNLVPRPMLPTFGPETAEVLELGAKATLLDHRLHVSAAAFTSDYEDIQVRTIEVNGLAPVTSNAGDARIRGGELEFELVAGPHVRLTGGIGRLHARYTDIAPSVADISLQSRLTDTPEWSANFGINGEIPLGRHLLSGRVDWSYRSSHFNDVENTPALRQDAFDVLNASMGWRCTDCAAPAWSVTLGVNNATDELYLITGNQLVVQGPVAASYARPREWYLTVAIDF
jgi:iron complex outermembrane receptor protein